MADIPAQRVPSTEFRVVFGRLTEPVTVTVQGRAIGVWSPLGQGIGQESSVVQSIPAATIQAGPAEAAREGAVSPLAVQSVRTPSGSYSKAAQAKGKR